MLDTHLQNVSYPRVVHRAMLSLLTGPRAHVLATLIQLSSTTLGRALVAVRLMELSQGVARQLRGGVPTEDRSTMSMSTWCSSRRPEGIRGYPILTIGSWLLGLQLGMASLDRRTAKICCIEGQASDISSPAPSRVPYVFNHVLSCFGICRTSTPITQRFLFLPR